MEQNRGRVEMRASTAAALSQAAGLPRELVAHVIFVGQCGRYTVFGMVFPSKVDVGLPVFT